MGVLVLDVRGSLVVEVPLFVAPQAALGAVVLSPNAPPVSGNPTGMVAVVPNRDLHRRVILTW
jgi:hypothetical protein